MTRFTGRPKRALVVVGSVLLLVGVIAAVAVAITGPARGHPGAVARATPVIPAGIHKIKHVVVIMQENRSL